MEDLRNCLSLNFFHCHWQAQFEAGNLASLCICAYSFRQVFFCYLPSRSHNHCALDTVFQLTYVSRPRICSERLESAIRNTRHPLTALLLKALHKESYELFQVFQSLAQWRQKYRIDVQTVIKVASKSAGFNL